MTLGFTGLASAANADADFPLVGVADIVVFDNHFKTELQTVIVYC